MSKNDHSKAGASLPLTEAILRETEILPERHHVKRPGSSRTARFDVGTASENEPPVVTTRLVRGHGYGGDAAWQVEVSVEGGQLRPSRPTALKVVQVHRSILARDAITSLPASMPLVEGTTVGGEAPQAGCSQAAAGTPARIDYTADYYFFTAK